MGRGRELLWIAVLFSVALLTAVLIFHSSPFETVSVSYPDKTLHRGTLPYIQSGELGTYVFSGTLDDGPLQQHIVRIVPDDCLQALTINGNTVDLSQYSGRCDWKDGFLIDLSPYTKPGHNDFVAIVENRGGVFTFTVRPSLHDWRFASLLGIACVICLLLILKVCRFFQLSWVLTLLILLLIIIRITYVFYFTYPEKYVFTDMGFYDKHAIKLLGNEPMWGGAFWPPFFYIFLAGIYAILKLFGVLGSRYWIIPLLHILLAAAVLPLLYLTVERLSSRRAAFVAAGIYVFYYPFWYLNVFFLSENLFIPLLIISLYVLVCKLNGGWGWWVILGVSLGLAVLTRPILAFFLPALVVWMLAVRAGSVRKILVFCAVVGALFAAQIAYNMAITDGDVRSISASGGPNFALAWCDLRSIAFYHGGISWRFSPPGLGDYPSHQVLTTNVPFTDQGYYYWTGVGCIQYDYSRLWYHKKNIGRMFTGTLFPYWSTVRGAKLLMATFFVFTYAVLLPLSLFSLLGKSHRKYVVLLFLLFLAAMLCVYLQAVGERRYALPFEIVFIILAPVGACRLWALWRSRQRDK